MYIYNESLPGSPTHVPEPLTTRTLGTRLVINQHKNILKLKMLGFLHSLLYYKIIVENCFK